MKKSELRQLIKEEISKVLKEQINFPEMEDELQGWQDAALGSDEEFLQGVLDASPKELIDINGGYYELASSVEQGYMKPMEAVKLAKAWAKEKLNK